MQNSSGCTRFGGLLLIGGGIGVTPATLVATFPELADRECSIPVLVTSASSDPATLYAEFAAGFAELGGVAMLHLHLTSRADAEDRRVLDVLAKATCVLFSGGDQSRLRVLVGTPAADLLRSRLREGSLVVAGTSAGAMALGDPMILGGDAERGVRLSDGIGLLPDTVVDTHFGQRHRLPRLLRAVTTAQCRLGVGIDEDTALLVTLDHYRLVGDGAVTFATASGRPHTWTTAPRVPDE